MSESGLVWKTDCESGLVWKTDLMGQMWRIKIFLSSQGPKTFNCVLTGTGSACMFTHQLFGPWQHWCTGIWIFMKLRNKSHEIKKVLSYPLRQDANLYVFPFFSFSVRMSSKVVETCKNGQNLDLTPLSYFNCKTLKWIFSKFISYRVACATFRSYPLKLFQL